jgi:hypothetical protein
MPEQPRHRPAVSDIALALATRQPRTGQPSIEVGESAQGLRYVKSLTMYQEDGEGWKQMCDRAAEALTYTSDKLRTNGAGK